MPVTPLRKPFVRPPEVAKIKIKIKIKIKSKAKQSKSKRKSKRKKNEWGVWCLERVALCATMANHLRSPP
ncbi:hypothetical protein ACJA3S_08255 [Pseudomonas sp. KnCO4]|uniref:hypothetical protein n=1 Tax=Pseudomonas sp. KnCO4 TaxID=3381355 RepID=UPI003877ECD2